MAFDPQSQSRLAQVPVEVLLRITYHLHTRDLENIRLSCKVLETNLFNFFAKEFFRKKQFFVSSASLQALIDISKHPTLSPFLQHVIISTDRIHGNYGYSQGRDLGQERALAVAMADHKTLMTTGVLRDMLVEAFGNLVNLETIDIRDFDSRSRNRDGLYTPWRSYGVLTLERGIPGISINPHPTSGYDSYASDVFGATNAALALSGARPANIEVILRNAQWGLGNSALLIPSRLRPSLEPMLASLKKLHLDIDYQGEVFMIQQFLTLSNNISWLRINAKSFSNSDHAFGRSRSLFGWLGLPTTQPPPNSYDMKAVDFPHLEQLDVGSCVIDLDTLFSCVAKFAPTLRVLNFRKVNLMDKKDNPDKINPWKTLLRKMQRLPNLHLRTLRLAQIKHVTGHTNNIYTPWRITFTDAGNQRPGGRPLEDITGSTSIDTIANMIEKLIGRMEADWPAPPPEDDDDDEDEEEEEDEDEDMADDD
ncbi:hypothetical protein QBC35DRAFT_389488 [Podospora australis]|uniref:F-box domain-containing protein n=1 Tax=Podospora australis TaxID=1536484 RepID=A0AAN7AG67_9PEZI|nr:hypothetical protein QBC35DRAFT_389488 [Podospora australis]